MPTSSIKNSVSVDKNEFTEFRDDVDHKFKKVDQKFEKVDQNFEELTDVMINGFDRVYNEMDTRFSGVEKDISDIKIHTAKMDKNIELIMKHLGIQPEFENGIIH